jgi:predicted RNA-binding Zn-ribbon protein involved in translation (DUF1610 family)
MLRRCPGIKGLVEPSITIRTCPACGEEVEFFGYETEAKCYNCGRMLHREATASCITWCEYALKCIADLKERKLITDARAEELEKIAKAAKTEK